MFDIRAAFEPLDGRVLKWRDFKEVLELILLNNISVLPAHFDSHDLHQQADKNGWLTEEAGAKIKISLTPEIKENCMPEQNEFNNWDPTMNGYRFTVLINGESMGGVSKVLTDAEFLYIQRALRKSDELMYRLVPNQLCNITIRLFDKTNNDSIRDFILNGKYKGYMPTAILDASTDGPVIEQFVFKLGY